MKKILLVVASVFALIVGLFFAVVGKNFVGLVPSVEGALAPGVQTVRDGYVNAFIVDLDEGVALVDCGNDPAAKTILTALAARSLKADAVKAIFITHGHPDHVAGCNAFPAATVYAFEEDRGLMEGSKAGAGPLPKMMGPQKDKTAKLGTPLVDGAVVQLGSVSVQAWKIPGHTQGSAAYLARDVLFLGDSATAETSGALRPAPWVFSDDVEQSKASMRALAAKVPETVKKTACAHSGALDGIAGLKGLAN